MTTRETSLRVGSAGRPASMDLCTACSRACSFTYMVFTVVCAPSGVTATSAEAMVRISIRRMTLRLPLPHLRVHLVEIVLRDEHLASLAPGSRRHEPVGLHHVHQPRRATEADAQAPLEVGNRCLTALDD